MLTLIINLLGGGHKRDNKSRRHKIPIFVEDRQDGHAFLRGEICLDFCLVVGAIAAFKGEQVGFLFRGWFWFFCHRGLGMVIYIFLFGFFLFFYVGCERVIRV